MADQVPNEEIKEEIKSVSENNEEKNEEQPKENEQNKEEEKGVEFVNQTKSEHKASIDPNLTAIEIIVRGTIEWGEFSEADGVCCTYELVAGDAWVKERVYQFIRASPLALRNIHINHSTPKTGWCGIFLLKTTIDRPT